MEEIIKDLEQISEDLYESNQYTCSDQVDEVIKKLRAQTTKGGQAEVQVRRLLAEKILDTLDNMDGTIFMEDCNECDKTGKIPLTIDEQIGLDWCPKCGGAGTIFNEKDFREEQIAIIEELLSKQSA